MSIARPKLWSTVLLATGAAALLGKEMLRPDTPFPALRPGEEMVAVRLCYDDYRSTEMRGEVPMSYLKHYATMLPRPLLRQLGSLPVRCSTEGPFEGGVRIVRHGKLQVRVIYPDPAEGGIIVVEWPLEGRGCTLSFCVEGLDDDLFADLLRLD